MICEMEFTGVQEMLMGVRGSWEFIGRIPGVHWKCGKQSMAVWALTGSLKPVHPIIQRGSLMYHNHAIQQFNDISS